jgi:hypothetical protein
MRCAAILLMLLVPTACAPSVKLMQPLDWAGRAEATPSGWWKVQTEHFTLYTDQPPEEARAAAEALAREWLALSAVMGGSRPPYRAPTTVYVLKSDLQFEELFGRSTWGFVRFSPKAASVFLYGPSDRWIKRTVLALDEKASVLQHELAHLILFQYFPVQPPWFAEGMAQFLETYKWLPDASAVELGLAHLPAYQAYRSFRSVGLADAKAWTEDKPLREVERHALYGYSWALVHYLINAQNDRFAAYLATLAQTQSADAAYQRSLGDLPADAVDRAVYEYMRAGSYETIVVPVSAQRTAASITACSDLEAAGVAKTLRSALSK